MKKYLLTLFICSLFLCLNAQQITFEKTFGDTSDVERGFCVKQTYDGGYIVTGTNSFDETGSENIMLIKTDPFGNQIWNKGQLDFSLYQCSPNSIKITPDSGFIITGGSWNLGGNIGAKDVFLLKTDKDGNEQWVHTYDSIQSNPAFGIYNERGLDVLYTNDNGFLVTGVAGYEAFLLKTDSIGNVLWITKDTGLCRAAGFSLIEAENNCYLVLGYTSPTLATNIGRMYLTKFDSTGNKIWGQPYSWNQGNYSLGYSVKVNSNEEYVLLGLGKYNGSQYGKMLLIKTDTSGNPIWEHSYIANNYTTGYSLDIANDGGYILAGESFDSIIGYRTYLVRTDSAGNQIWDSTYSGDVGYSIQQTIDNGFVIAGVKLGDIYLLKTDSNGIVLFVSENNTEGEKSLLIYPNPASYFSTILFSSRETFLYDVDIYDSDAKFISSLKRLKTNQEYILNKIPFKKGIYFLNIYKDNHCLGVRKIVTIK